MSILNKIQENLFRSFLSLKETDWVEWIAQPNEWQDDCDKFNGCHFIVKNMPQYPQHPYCQCQLNKITKPVPYVTATAVCDIRKFTEYIFNELNSKGKTAVFEGMGYNYNDSMQLQQLYMQQALEKYCNGDYKYKGVNNFCAKIEIVIEIADSSGRINSLITGWQIKPNGKIILTTPFSGRIN